MAMMRDLENGIKDLKQALEKAAASSDPAGMRAALKEAAQACVKMEQGAGRLRRKAKEEP